MNEDVQLLMSFTKLLSDSKYTYFVFAHNEQQGFAIGDMHPKDLINCLESTIANSAGFRKSVIAALSELMPYFKEANNIPDKDMEVIANLLKTLFNSPNLINNGAEN